MSKRCPDCGFVNEDTRLYCGSCGAPLDAELRLMTELNNQTSGEQKKAYKEPPERHEPSSRPFRSEFDDDAAPAKLSRKKESNHMPLIVLGLIAAAVIVIMVIMS